MDSRSVFEWIVWIQPDICWCSVRVADTVLLQGTMLMLLFYSVPQERHDPVCYSLGTC
jgi:hypothetical protein